MFLMPVSAGIHGSSQVAGKSSNKINFHEEMDLSFIEIQSVECRTLGEVRDCSMTVTDGTP